MLEVYNIVFSFILLFVGFWAYLNHDNLIKKQLDITDQVLQKISLINDDDLYRDEGQKTLFNYTGEEEWKLWVLKV